MSAAGTTLQVCPNIQDSLDNYFNTCNASQLREAMPFFDFLWSPMNREGVSQSIREKVAPGGGKQRTVELVYDQRILESAVSTVSSCALDCTSTTKRGNLSTEYTIDCSGYQVDELMDAADWVNICTSNGDIFSKKLQSLIDALVRKTATGLTAQAAALIGGWDSSIDSMVTSEFLQVRTIKDGTTADLEPGTMEDIDWALSRSGFCNGAVIFAGRTLHKYARTLTAGCCSNQGIDLGGILASFGKAVVNDRRVDAAIADADKAWAVMPGVLQPIYFTFNDNGLPEAAGVVGTNYIKRVIYDPQSGLPIDLTIKDDCGGVSVVLRSMAKVVALPLDMFHPSDTMAGVNYFAGIEVNNA
jgi:hypothetical protein